eukprot:GILK01002365.1.p1 GENE.GILK01002365.1~~GILK01002365.1.p1  ORF type:complete len:216 (+),score=28.99 GILK01002365.1:136-783(+)
MHKNHYRHGVLISNYVEDAFGAQLATTRPPPEPTPSSEQRDSFSARSLTQTNRKTEGPTLVADTFSSRFGLPAHLVMGHGMNTDELHKQEHLSTYDLMYQHPATTDGKRAQEKLYKTTEELQVRSPTVKSQQLKMKYESGVSEYTADNFYQTTHKLSHRDTTGHVTSPTGQATVVAGNFRRLRRDEPPINVPKGKPYGEFSRSCDANFNKTGLRA